MATPRKKPEDILPSGRPSEYNEKMDEQVFEMALLGLTDKEMAKIFGVTEQTLNSWKRTFPKFLSSLKAGKDEADQKVARSLYEKACGYKDKEVKAFCHEGMIITEEIEKSYPPDTTAIIYWLKNRQSKKWRDKTEVEQDISGNLGVSFTFTEK